MKPALEKLRHLLQVSSSDPEDARRRGLLNILLIGSLVSEVIGFLILCFGILLKRWSFSEAAFLLAYMLVFILLTLVIFFINRQWGRAAAYLFLFLFIIGYAFSDAPAQVANGRSVFYYALPLVMASLLIHPAASFIVAVIGCGIITWTNAIAYPGSTPDFFFMIGFFLLALISWLATRSLEDALRNLRKSHADLDRLVQERTQALAVSLESEQAEAGRSKAILESIADGVIVFDCNSTAILANTASACLLDMQVDQIVGSTIGSLIQSKSLPAHSRAILSDRLAYPGVGPANNLKIDWARNTLSISSAPVKDAAGASIGTVAVFRDYSREAEVDRMKNSFVAIVSHELRTPLNAIFGYTEMLKDGLYGQVSPSQAQASDRIMSNTQRMLGIVSDLLDQTQMEAGKLSLHNQPFRPSELIENVRTVVDKIIADKGLVLTCQLDPKLPECILGDSARLQQILVNLINNAVKFTEKGSIHISVSYSGVKSWSMRVQDTGIGIPENELATIFEAFRQVDSAAARKYGGSGLGLTIVKQLTELMDGNIAVQSKPGAGSTFIISLPLVQAEMITPINE